MTSLEKKLFREKIIHEYKRNHPIKQKETVYDSFLKSMKRVAPLNISVGIVAFIFLLIWKGWDVVGQLLLSGVIWITLISTAISAFPKRK